MVTLFLFSLFILFSCSYSVFIASGSYCLFLVILSLLSSLIIYSYSLSFWYCIILLLIYIGGVYVLLLFVSLHSYNSFSNSSYINAFLISFIGIFCFFYSYNSFDFDFLSIYDIGYYSDNSYNLVNNLNWVNYLFILIVILLSFNVFGFIFINNNNYYR
uniref:NADH dehydrogenase subunit 6 n=1 Tax=Cichlidarus nyanzae TaxID=608002 RepID=A0A2Z4GPJ7_9PLAT|nr:NADH dehydrogenase subunit 6 [Gyrodactylus nyanzae]AWW03133.1 NADH dehydrogenase subunit 6 [Gyrodactylus nyanzae]